MRGVGHWDDPAFGPMGHPCGLRGHGGLDYGGFVARMRPKAGMRGVGHCHVPPHSAQWAIHAGYEPGWRGSCLTEIAGRIDRQTPIRLIETHRHMALKRRMWPIGGTVCPAMLDRVEMDVVQVPCKIILIAESVLPEAPLP